MKKTVAVLLVILTLSSLMGCFRRSKADVYKKEFDIKVPPIKNRTGVEIKGFE